MRRASLAVFFLAAGIPFVVAYGAFLYAQRASLLSDPAAYMAMLQHDGFSNHSVPFRTWKYYLARDPRCTGADVIVIGSSRTAEIADDVVGARTCNLWVPALGAPTFAMLADRLPAAREGQIVYLGLDHIFFWARAEDDDWVEISRISRAAWWAWRLFAPLDLFSIAELREAVRRYRDHEDQRRLDQWVRAWYPDGHGRYPRYYIRKRAGVHPPFPERRIEALVDEELSSGYPSRGHLRAFARGVRVLHAKGYAVRVYWNPMSHLYVTRAEERYPRVFWQTIETVDRLIAELPIERYLPASATLDASRIGCSDTDLRDESHVDLDCVRRVFGAFGDPGAPRLVLTRTTPVPAIAR